MTNTDQPETHNIRLLPEHLIDQIKAGEVIERPASLIKELIENSLDANSRKIDIHIRDNGLELISIEDDGEGINFSDLPYAFCRHATSKIERFEDIYNLNSFGFRGEALASISSTSRLTCVSTPKSKPDNGGKIVIHGGEQKSLSSQKSNTSGTSIFVKDLFFNTPARLKFVKSKASEKNALKKVLNSFLLSNPQTTFSIKWDDKEKEFYPQQEDINRISAILFKRNDDNKELIKFEKTYEGHSIKGFISKSSSRGNAGKNHYLFANNRPFVDRQLHMGIVRSMEQYWSPGEIGHYCVMITVPADKIDVNVHPNKTQVKFLKNSIVFSLLSSAIKESILKETSLITSQIENNEASRKDSLPTSIDKFSNSPFDNNSQTITYAQEFKESQGKNDSYFFLNQDISLFKDQVQSNYLLHLPRLLGSFLWSQMQDHGESRVDGEHTTPLLISEPFSFKKGVIDTFIPMLKNIGYEFDRLDENMIVLRSFPNYLTSLPIQGIVHIILQQLEKNAQQEQNLFSILEESLLNPSWSLNFSLDNIQIDLMRDYYGIRDLESKKIVVNIGDQKLEEIFQR